MDDTYAIEAVATVGSVQATFHGTLSISDVDPPWGCRLSGSGNAGPAGCANGSAGVRLLADRGATRLTYTVDVVVGGKLAEIGGKVIEAAMQQMADAFFDRFVALVATPSDPVSDVVPDPAQAGAPPPEASPAGSVARRGLRPLLWVPSLILLVVAILIVFSRP
jgi:carbon monoxide dehydrogenase subunit G